MHPSCCLSDAEYIALLEADQDISPKSRRTYVLALARAQRLAAPKAGGDPRPLCWVLTHPAEAYAALRAAVDNPASLKTMVVALLAVVRRSGVKAACRELFLEWHDRLSELSAALREREESNEPTPRQKAAAVTWEAVEAALARLAEEEPGSPAHLLLAMHALGAVRRQEDYARVYVYQRPGDATPREAHDAYIDLTPKAPARPFMTIRRYKTAKQYGEYRQELCNDLAAVIRASLRARPRPYLFVRRDGASPYGEDTNAFTVWANGALRRVLGNPRVTVNSLRHARATWSRHHLFSVAEQREEAAKMAHDWETHARYAFKPGTLQKSKSK